MEQKELTRSNSFAKIQITSDYETTFAVLQSLRPVSWRTQELIRHGIEISRMTDGATPFIDSQGLPMRKSVVY
jgi:hypothetical protein